MNQMPDGQLFTDHLGNEHPVDARQDIYSHRVLVWLNGWMATPKLRYTIAWWTVNTTNQSAIFGNIGYQFSKASISTPASSAIPVRGQCSAPSPTGSAPTA